MRLGRFIRSLQVHVPPSLTATCQPLPLSMKVGRTIYIGSFSAGRTEGPPGSTTVYRDLQHRVPEHIALVAIAISWYICSWSVLACRGVLLVPGITGLFGPT